MNRPLGTADHRPHWLSSTKVHPASRKPSWDLSSSAGMSQLSAAAVLPWGGKRSSPDTVLWKERQEQGHRLLLVSYGSPLQGHWRSGRIPARPSATKHAVSWGLRTLSWAISFSERRASTCGGPCMEHRQPEAPQTAEWGVCPEEGSGFIDTTKGLWSQPSLCELPPSWPQTSNWVLLRLPHAGEERTT